MKRRIASVTPLWNQEMWIKPHFDMLASLDKNLVLLQREPLPSYYREHGYKKQPDRSEKILKEYFPNVEIVESAYPAWMDFRAELYNEGLAMLEDYDIVFRLDPDMFWTKDNWEKMLQYINDTNFDAYRMDFSPDSINYYMTGDFEHGLKDAKEHDVLATNPKKHFTYHENATSVNPLGWNHGNDTFFRWEGFMCHHFRGWNKPKSTPNPGWLEKPGTMESFAKYSDNGKWFVCPDEIRTPVEAWQKELATIEN